MIDRERLENMSPIGFDLNGDVLLKSEDYHWLMEQAERVQELEEDNVILKATRAGNEEHIDMLHKQNKRYRKAINNIIEKAMLFGTNEEVYDAIHDAIKELEG